jgi:nicotinate-nucleotide--dimethylbenzimidazole phosphoribosyltransferase
MKKYAEIVAAIRAVDKTVESDAKARLDSLTKPVGSLGILEDCAWRYAAARGELRARVRKPCMLTFAGDHGVADEGVSAYPQEVTPQMVANFARGGAAINVLCRDASADLKVIDMGTAIPCRFPGVIDHRLGAGTANIAKGPAMTRLQAETAIEAGAAEAGIAINDGATLLGTGDMGIANTTPSAALYSVLLGIDPEWVAGRGTGIDDARLAHKISVIRNAISVNCPDASDPLGVLAALGGFEIAGICGAILGAASEQIPIVVDGFISGAAALVAMRIRPDVADYCFFSHLSAESGHVAAISAMGIRPLLNLNLRLGEGTGAALAFHLIRAANAILNEMATFSDAGVSTADKQE